MVSFRQEYRRAALNCKKNKAFTLIELMVAAAILAVMISGLLMTYVSCLFLNQANVNLTKAAGSAHFVLEELTGVSYGQIEDYSPPSFGNLKNEIIGVDITEKSGRKEVTVEVAWTERNRNRSFKLFTVFHE